MRNSWIVSTDGRAVESLNSCTFSDMRVVVDAIQDEIVLERMNSVYVEISGSPGAGCAALCGVRAHFHAGNEAQQIVPVAKIQRR